MFEGKMHMNLLKIEQVPEHFHELFIVSGYRSPKSSARQCLISMFQPTNETLNFWTHFLPGLYFCWVLCCMATQVDFVSDAYTWPLLAYMVSACLFPILSAVAHMFNTMSDVARHICFFLDYWALGLYSLGAAIGYRAYIFPPELLHTSFADYYVLVATCFGVISMLLCCETRFMDHGILRKLMRFSSFSIPYMWDSLPVIYRIIFCQHDDCRSLALWYHLWQFFFAFSAGILYVTHFPERWKPGMFDVFGHSHQIFHVATVFGAHYQMQGLLLDLQGRKEFFLTNDHPPSFWTSLAPLLLVGSINTLVFVFFKHKLHRLLPHVVRKGSWLNLRDMNGKKSH